jgi:hypothetical protein
MRRDGALLAMKPVIFSTHSDGPDRTGLVALAELYVDQLWIPTHLAPDQAREFVRDQFKRAVAADLEMLEVIESNAGVG